MGAEGESLQDKIQYITNTRGIPLSVSQLLQSSIDDDVNHLGGTFASYANTSIPRLDAEDRTILPAILSNIKHRG